MQFEARVEEQLEREAQFYYKNQPLHMQKQNQPFYATIKHERSNSCNVVSTSKKQSPIRKSNENKKEFLKRKQVYDPKEAIKQQKGKVKQ